ncbi:MAG: fimbrillin family protein, partial [Prevotella sp.]|nr:fimbrillin family protein [Prevotella sp.]
MKHYISLFIFMSLLLLSSCGMENLVSDGGGDSDIIRFDVACPDTAEGSRGAFTRASKLTSLPDFKVYAYNASGTAVINGKVFTANGTSKDGTAYYWPKTGNVTFYAFAPASNGSVVFNTSSKTLTYTAPAAQGSQQDVIYATATKSRPTDGKVSLAFKHATAALSVSWSRAGDLPSTTTVSVSNVKVCNVKQTGTLSFGSGMTAGGSNISSDLGASGLMMLAPQTTSPWKNGAFTSSSGSYLAVSCKVNANGSYVVGSASADGTVYYPLSQALTAGRATTVNLVFGTKQSDGSRTFGYNANGTRVSQSDAKEPVPSAVDLGLSVKWASFNLGASKPEEYGKYYAWAATTGYASSESHDFSWANTPYCTNPSNPSSSSSWSKYNSGDAKLESAGDAATVNLGGSWRMPTHAEWQELSSKCTWTWTSQNGINGYKVVSASNGNWIFLPAAGYRYGTGSNDVGSNGNYWSSQVYSSRVVNAWDMLFGSGGRNPDDYSYRYNGFSV